MTRRLTGLDEIASAYRAFFCDVWGVVHNGREIYQESAKALKLFRESGGHVVLITNSPRPHQGVEAQLRDLGLPDGVYDAIATSGDVTRTLIARAEAPVFHLGPDRDRPLFEGLDVSFAPLETARSIVCTGLFDDEREQPEDYREVLIEAAKRKLPFICANPDIVVERGERLIWCAGALARLYDELGGETFLAGKPYKPIYDLAQEKLAAVSETEVAKKGILAIGDGMPTDVAGARDNDYDLLYIAAGIHGSDYGGHDPDEDALERFLIENNAAPVAWMPHLAWNGD